MLLTRPSSIRTARTPSTSPSRRTSSAGPPLIEASSTESLARRRCSPPHEHASDLVDPHDRLRWRGFQLTTVADEHHIRRHDVEQLLKCSRLYRSSERRQGSAGIGR
jgi:hypothetical protein